MREFEAAAGLPASPEAADAALLAAYDAQLRDVAEVPGADSWVRIGPVIAARYAGGRGFVTYRALLGPDGTPLPAAAIAALVREVADHFIAQDDITVVEWKTRGHDHAPGLEQALADAGFQAGEPESIMIGEAAALAVEVPLPPGVAIRGITTAQDIRAMAAMQEEVFAHSMPGMAQDLLRRLANGRDDLELWIAEGPAAPEDAKAGDADSPHGAAGAGAAGPTAGAGDADSPAGAGDADSPAGAGDAAGIIICAGRLEPVPGTQFAGLWGGCTRPEWRHRGVYRALTARRARSAVMRGVRYLHSDSTEYSRPILERSGFRRVGTTTPYEWRRPTQAGPS